MTGKSTSFWEGFSQSFLLIGLSEIGDRTFLLVSIFATKLNKVAVFFLGSLIMSLLQVISVGIGSLFPFILTQSVTNIIAIGLFFTFGAYMVFDSLFGNRDDDEDEELELREEIAKKEGLTEPLVGDDEASPAHQVERPQAKGGSYWMFIAMLSCGEIGDKSQITAIALAASYTPLSVIIGGALGFTLCVFLAILVGKLVQDNLNERWLNLIGGLLFIGFGAYMLYTKVIFSPDMAL
mmetsp:Transcript_31411/g.30759  ORF Transcript_31411/g.30759 Transcript_31411/m.30759 type:complete len:237 (-) Transcript_31411:47-757(-)